MKKLLEDLHRDLGKIAAPKEAHVSIDQIMAHYYKRAENPESQTPSASEGNPVSQSGTKKD